MSKDLLQLINEFAAETGLSGHRITKLAGNTRLYERLARGDGKRIWPETEIKVRAYIMSQRSNPNRRRSRKTTTKEPHHVGNQD